MSGDREPRLVPPPRPRAASGGGRRAGDRRRTWGLALTAAGLLALAGAAGAVFLVLPDWLERRRAEAAARPPEDPAQPVPLVRQAAPEPPPAVPARPAAETPTSPPPAPPAAAPAPAADPAPAAPLAPTPFERALGEGLAAAAAGDAAAARQAFARAVALDPGSEPAAAGLARAEEDLRSARIAAHREAARAHEASERWREALAQHEAALALDPTLDFARRGVERTRRRAELDERLRFHLDRADRLSSPEVRAEVGELLAAAAAAVEEGGPLLDDQRRRLAALLARATTRVAVVLESDGLTEVTVYRVGELGRFQRRELELLPGTYVVVGRRSGYRDVRHRLEVRADGAGEPLVVRCEEAI